MTTLVFSYSHVDEALRNELEKHLAPLRRQGLIEPWHDRRIIAGQEFGKEIDGNFASADIVLLLISPDFINSDYCYEIEMMQSLRRHEAGEAIVIPVILRPCHWQDLPFGKLQAATHDGKPVTQFPTHDEGFYHVVEAIKRAVEKLNRARGLRQPSAVAVSKAVVAEVTPQAKVARSSNLRVKQGFSDRDRDNARAECIEFVANYFSNSLDELSRRNRDIETNFRRIDANTFEAAIYIAGEKRSMCGVWLSSGNFGGDILYSSSGFSRNSYNESLSLGDDGFTLGFKPLGRARYSGNENKLLNFEGVAELLWSLFVQPLQ